MQDGQLFRVVFASSESSECRSTDLELPLKLSRNPAERPSGWCSARGCAYPQELGFCLFSRSRVTGIRILAHEYLIAHKITVYVGDDGRRPDPQGEEGEEDDDDRARRDRDLAAYRRADFVRLGHLRFDDNARSHFSARETKEVRLDEHARFVKLVLHAPYNNKYNHEGQVALLQVAILGATTAEAKPSGGAPAELGKLREAQAEPWADDFTFIETLTGVRAGDLEERVAERLAEPLPNKAGAGAGGQAKDIEFQSRGLQTAVVGELRRLGIPPALVSAGSVNFDDETAAVLCQLIEIRDEAEAALDVRQARAIHKAITQIKPLGKRIDAAMQRKAAALRAEDYDLAGHAKDELAELRARRDELAGFFLQRHRDEQRQQEAEEAEQRRLALEAAAQAEAAAEAEAARAREGEERWRDEPEPEPEPEHEHEPEPEPEEEEPEPEPTPEPETVIGNAMRDRLEQEQLEPSRRPLPAAAKVDAFALEAAFGELATTCLLDSAWNVRLCALQVCLEALRAKTTLPLSTAQEFRALAELLGHALHDTVPQVYHAALDVLAYAMASGDRGAAGFGVRTVAMRDVRKALRAAVPALLQQACDGTHHTQQLTRDALLDLATQDSVGPRVVAELIARHAREDRPTEHTDDRAARDVVLETELMTELSRAHGSEVPLPPAVDVLKHALRHHHGEPRDAGRALATELYRRHGQEPLQLELDELNPRLKEELLQGFLEVDNELEDPAAREAAQERSRRWSFGVAGEDVDLVRAAEREMLSGDSPDLGGDSDGDAGESKGGVGESVGESKGGVGESVGESKGEGGGEGEGEGEGEADAKGEGEGEGEADAKGEGEGEGEGEADAKGEGKGEGVGEPDAADAAADADADADADAKAGDGDSIDPTKLV